VLAARVTVCQKVKAGVVSGEAHSLAMS